MLASKSVISKCLSYLVGQKLRAARLKKRLSLQEVCYEQDFTAPQLSSIERGITMPGIANLLILCSVYDVNITWVLFGEPDDILKDQVMPFAQDIFSICEDIPPANLS